MKGKPEKIQMTQAEAQATLLYRAAWTFGWAIPIGLVWAIWSGMDGRVAVTCLILLAPALGAAFLGAWVRGNALGWGDKDSSYTRRVNERRTASWIASVALTAVTLVLLLLEIWVPAGGRFAWTGAVTCGVALFYLGFGVRWDDSW